MNIFVTGASGHIGTVLIPELLTAGHQVTGLARSDEAADKLRAAGAEVLRGSLEDLEVLKSGAARADGVIHLAFRHDVAFSGGMDQAVASDLQALQAFAEALDGSGKPLVGISGTLLLAFAGLARTGLESDVIDMPGRGANENFVIELAGKNIRSSVVRLAPTVHGPLDNTSGFIPTFIQIARRTGQSAYVGDGANHWPAVHELDAARLLRLAVEKAPAGSRLHGVGDEAIAFKTIAETIGAQLNVPVQSISGEAGLEHFKPLGAFAALDNPVSNQLTRDTLGWEPTHPGLIDDLKHGSYFKT